jgi:hypothetical protein
MTVGSAVPANPRIEADTPDECITKPERIIYVVIRDSHLLKLALCLTVCVVMPCRGLTKTGAPSSALSFAVN